uniref:Uncharacterized protein n=1 Tax=Erpetoichthys calabaricus TaxID=27687 RepID=A0A8C4T117_ERPCA
MYIYLSVCLFKKLQLPQESKTFCLALAQKPRQKLGYHLGNPMYFWNCERKIARLYRQESNDPLYVNMIGTCHSEQIKPGILKPQHIDLYQINMARGLTYYPPDDLSTMLSEKKLTLDQMGALLQKQHLKDWPFSFSWQPPLIHPLAEYFNDTFSSTDSSLPPHVSIDVQEFVFSSATQSCPFSMTNHTMGKVSIAWVCTANSVFTISPQACDIPPLKSTAFRVTFTPDKTNALYGAELECFASYKYCTLCCVTRSTLPIQILSNFLSLTPVLAWCNTLMSVNQQLSSGNIIQKSFDIF